MFFLIYCSSLFLLTEYTDPLIVDAKLLCNTKFPVFALTLMKMFFFHRPTFFSNFRQHSFNLTQCHCSTYTEPPFSSSLLFLSALIFSFLPQFSFEFSETLSNLSQRQDLSRLLRSWPCCIFIEKTQLKKETVFRVKTSDCLLIFICVVE